MDSGKNSREHRAIQGKFDVIVEHLAANTDPAQFAQKLYQVEMVSQHVVEGARVVVFTPSQRIQPVMVAVQSCIQLQPSKYADFIQVVRDVYPALADVLNEYYMSSLEINVVDAIADVSEWEELACQIDLDLGKLHELQQSGKSPDQCKKELLRYWIDKDKRASWTKLSQALERMKKVEIAQMIKEKYFQPCSQGAENKMDSGKNSREHRAIQGKFDVIVEHLAANTDPAQFAQKLYQVEMVSQHVVEGASIVRVLTPTQRIRPVMVAVQSCIQLQPSKYADFIQVVRDVYPALADVLNEYYMSSLEINVVDAVADVSEWEELACQIDLDLGKLHELQQSGKSPDQCKKELLRYWIDKDKRASWTKLSQALERMKKVEIAQMIKEKYCQPCSQDKQEEASEDEESGDEAKEDENDTISMEIEEFEDRFRDLAYDAKVGIEERTPIRKFRHALQLLPLSIRHDHRQFLENSLPNIDKAENIDEIFRYLNLYWNFIDYHLLEYVIKKFGNKSLKAKMAKYVRDLAEFRKNTTIAQVCRFAKSWSIRPDLPQHFSTLRTKFSKSAAEYTLEELEQFRLNFCREFSLSLSESVAMLAAGVTDGSVIISWHIPSSFVDDLTAAIFSHPRSFFEEQLVVEIVLNGICAYNAQQALPSSPRCEGEVTDAEVGTKPSSLSLEIPPLDEDEEALLKACGDGRLEEVDRLIQMGVNVNIIEPSGDTDTPLMLASWEGDTKIVQCLLKAGALVNLQDPDGFTALILASKNGHQHIVLELLHAGADTDMQTKHGDTALIRATVNGHHPIVQELLKTGADPNIQNQSGTTALTLASKHGYCRIVKHLFKAGADPIIQNENRDTALILATISSHHPIVQELLKTGADPNSQNQHGHTALNYASEKGEALVVQELLQAGADPNIQSKSGDTALTLASEHGYCRIVKDLLKAGADPNIQNKHGRTALSYASEKGETLVVQELVQAGADPNIQSKSGNTALICASAKGHHDVAVELITARADVDVQNQSGNTALICASAEGHHDVAVELITARADVNVPNQRGSTALMLACKGGHHNIVVELLTARADVNARHKKGHTALILAVNWGHLEIVPDLIQAGADVNIQDEDGDSALMVSAYNGYPDIVERLIKIGAELNIINEDGLTPLQAAIQKHHTEVVRKLLDAGADIDIAEKTTGWTALFFAAKEGEADIMQLLLQRGADLRTVDKKKVTAIEVAQAHGHEEVCQILHDYLQSQQSLQVSAGDADKPPKSQLLSLPATEVSAGDTDQPTESDRQQALKDRVISTSNYFKTLFKRLEERLLSSKAEKTRAIKEFQSYPSPHRQTSKRAKKGKRQSDKRSKTVDVNIPAVP